MNLTTKISFKLNAAEVRRLTRSPSGPVATMTKKTAEDVARRAKAAAPVDSGQYKASIRVIGPTDGPTGPVCVVVSTSPYALAIENLQKPVLRDALRGAKIIV
jgi:hypothetical protein